MNAEVLFGARESYVNGALFLIGTGIDVLQYQKNVGGPIIQVLEKGPKLPLIFEQSVKDALQALIQFLEDVHLVKKQVAGLNSIVQRIIGFIGSQLIVFLPGHDTDWWERAGERGKGYQWPVCGRRVPAGWPCAGLKVGIVFINLYLFV